MSKELKHTKGEWEVRGNRIFIKGTYRSIADVLVIDNYDQISGKQKTDHEAIANAKLIASTPELLEALIKTKDTIEETSKCPFLPDWIKVLLHTRLCEIETAINKATS